MPFRFWKKITFRNIVSVITAIAGVCVIIGGVDGKDTLAGISTALFSLVSRSLMSGTMRRVTQKYDPLSVTTSGILIAAVCALPVFAVESAGRSMPSRRSAVRPSWWDSFYMTVVCTALTHLLWSRSLSMMEAGNCSLFYPLQPVTFALLCFLFLHETPHLTFVIGATMILGEILFSFPSIRQSQPAEQVILPTQIVIGARTALPPAACRAAALFWHRERERIVRHFPDFPCRNRAKHVHESVAAGDTEVVRKRSD